MANGDFGRPRPEMRAFQGLTKLFGGYSRQTGSSSASVRGASGQQDSNTESRPSPLPAEESDTPGSHPGPLFDSLISANSQRVWGPTCYSCVGAALGGVAAVLVVLTGVQVPTAASSRPWPPSRGCSLPHRDDSIRRPRGDGPESSSDESSSPDVPPSDLAFAAGLAELAQFQQPLAPQIEATTATPLPTAAQASTQGLYAAFGVQGMLASATGIAPYSLPGADVVLGGEAAIRATTDAGDLLGSSPSVLNLGMQRRNPIVTDPRVRGSRVGSLAASGSYWVPADRPRHGAQQDRFADHRPDYRDSRSVHGAVRPRVRIHRLRAARAPRYENGFEIHGQTVVDFKTNGENWYGRQSAWGGDSDWGFRVGYGHATGNDYDSGNGTQIPSSYKSRDVDVAFGAELTDNSTSTSTTCGSIRPTSSFRARRSTSTFSTPTATNSRTSCRTRRRSTSSCSRRGTTARCSKAAPSARARARSFRSTTSSTSSASPTSTRCRPATARRGVGTAATTIA